MAKIRTLIYGDSNTWGYSKGGARYSTNKQWPNILQKLLGEDYEITQDGLGGRTAGNLDEAKPYRNGLDHFEVALHSSSPLDCVIIALGINDVKNKYNCSAEQIAANLAHYAKMLKSFSQKSQSRSKSNIIFLGEQLNANERISAENLETLKNVYKILQESGYKVIIPPNIERIEDGIHYSAQGQQQVAEIVTQELPIVIENIEGENL